VASQIPANRKRLLECPKAGPISHRLFERLPMMPRFSVEHVRQRLETTFPTASAAVKLLKDLGILTEFTGQKKNRIHSYQAYVELLSRRRWPASPRMSAALLVAINGRVSCPASTRHPRRCGEAGPQTRDFPRQSAFSSPGVSGRAPA
jgi:hypothetical protein